MYGTITYWLQLGHDYGYRRQCMHLWRRWRDPEHDRIQCVRCCTDCDVEEAVDANDQTMEGYLGWLEDTPLDQLPPGEHPRDVEKG